MATTSSLNTSGEDVLRSFGVQTTSRGHHYLDTSQHIKSFSLFDYCIFSAMLVFSALIGVYFAFCAKQKQNTTSEYLMGGKTMGIIPVSMSLLASCISGITLLGASAEMYTYGTQYATTIFGLLFASIICGVFFIPVYCRLQLNTSYEYLELRFDRRVRLLGSVLFLINNLLYVPIVIYIPALAFRQVSGVNVHLITPLVCLVCIFYTSLGGLKAVVWADVLQTVLMFGGIIAVVWIGTDSVGGFEEVWERNERSGRIEFFKMNPDPTVRHTFWNTVFGATFNWVTHLCVNPGMVQRYLSMPTIKRAQLMLLLFTFGIILLYAISLYAGLVIYASYYDCDLVSTKIVRASDQVLPYFVMDVTTSMPGFPGLFIAGVFSAALSSMSTDINAVAGVVYEDFIEPTLKVKLSEERASFLMKIISVLFGIACVAMVFVVENLGAVIQASWSLGGVTQGPMTAVFVLGMFFPWTNAKGTLIGGITGLIVMGFICFGTQAAIASGQIKFDKKPVSTEGCAFLLKSENFTMEEAMNTTGQYLPYYTEASPTSEYVPVEDGPLPVFRLSYTLYTLVGLIITVAVGLAASALTGPTDPADVHIDLLTPAIRPLYSSRCKGGEDSAKRKLPENVEVVKELDVIHNVLKSHDQSEDKGRMSDVK